MGKSLRIGVLAPPWVPVPPQTYGGTEIMVDILCRGFAEHGHTPVLFTPGDSTCPVEKVVTKPSSQMPPDKYQEQIQLAAIMRQAKSLKLDIIHSHLEGILAFADLLPCPVVCTVHIPIGEQLKTYLSRYQDHNIVSISNSHAATFPFETKMIYNGIETSTFPLKEKKDDYLAFLGALSADKGVDVAVRTAVALGKKIKVAGYIRPGERPWFEREVVRQMGTGQIELLGPVNHAQKVKLLSNASAVLCPVRWQEPFGLVTVEAMACGTPVVAMSNGAFSEIIEHGVSGILCNKRSDFADCCGQASRIQPAAARARVEKMFNHNIMIESYLQYFEEILAR
jgi:glycosyltransferase involved in cell wall biosynthesis